MSSSEMKRCERCNSMAFLEKHHVWPKSIFLGLGPVIELCPNCHREYHIKLGKKKLQNPDTEYHEKTFDFWWKTGIIMVILVAILISQFS